MTGRGGLPAFFLCVLLFLTSGSLPALAQAPDSSVQSIEGATPDTSMRPQALPDSVQRPTPGTPSAAKASRSGLKEPVKFTATDSLVIVFDEEGGDVGTLIGNANVTYGQTNLTAHEVDILFDIEELRAKGLEVDTGMVGRPHFTSGTDSFDGSSLAFNLRTNRGRVVTARTQLDDGYIQGEVVKVDEDSTLYIQGGAYTTCNCPDDPSYTLRASKMKVVDEKWVFTGPIQLYIFNIPTPLWLPFGFLPATEGRRTGPLPPNYGEDERGFFLRDFGWYFALSDYLDLQMRFGIWTKGSWQVSPFFRYNRRDRYSGQFQLDYVNNRMGERGDPDLVKIRTSSIRWNHNQTLSPYSSFSANVNLSSANYLKTISENYNDRVRQTVESSIRFDKTWAGPQRRLNLNMSQRQVLATGEVSMTIPGLSFTQGTRNPFARKNRIGPERWYERITYSYTGRLDNRFDFRRDTTFARDDPEALNASWWDALLSRDLYRRATGDDTPFDFRAQHSLPISAYFTINRIPVINKTFRLNVSTSLNYAENWYINTIRRFVDTTGVVQTVNVPGFFAHRQYSTSISANTTFYGLFPFKIWRFNGFRHTVRPTASMSFAPDYTSDFWGYVRTYVDKDGREVPYAIAPGISAFGGRQQSLSINVANVLESKMARVDSVGDREDRKVKILDFDFSTAYNFAADSLRMSDIFFNARTSIGNQLHLTFRASFSPYKQDVQGNRINDYVFSPLNLRFARLTRMDFSARTSFRSSGAQGGRPVGNTRARLTGSPMILPGDPLYQPDDPFTSPYFNSPVGYADFAIPWSLNLDLTYSQANLPTHVQRTAVVNAAFDFNLTPNWKVQGRTGYDLVRNDFSTSTISIFRDFECWEMSFNWVPFGVYQSYSFDLHVKSGKLRDLLRIRQPRSDIRGRFEGLLN